MSYHGAQKNVPSQNTLVEVKKYNSVFKKKRKLSQKQKSRRQLKKTKKIQKPKSRRQLKTTVKLQNQPAGYIGGQVFQNTNISSIRNPNTNSVKSTNTSNVFKQILEMSNNEINNIFRTPSRTPSRTSQKHNFLRNHQSLQTSKVK